MLALAVVGVLGLFVLFAIAIQVLRARLAAARHAMGDLQVRVTHAEDDVDAAIERLDALHQLRVDDVQRMRDDVRELRDNYERVIERYRATHAIDGPLGSDRVQ
jgi:Skp family chaperone for outer membrane proteins